MKARIWFQIHPDDSPHSFQDVLDRYADGEENGFICPWCHLAGNDSYQVGDYVAFVEHGRQTREHEACMLWCDCGARAVALTKTICEVAESDLTREEREAIDRYRENHNVTHLFRYGEVELAWIDRVYNRQLFRFPESEPSQERLREWITENWSEDQRGTSHIPNHLSGKDFGYIQQPDFTRGLEVHSYNVETPQVSYPKEFDLSHDGIYIYLLCRDENGVEFQFVYWGD